MSGIFFHMGRSDERLPLKQTLSCSEERRRPSSHMCECGFGEAGGREEIKVMIQLDFRAEKLLNQVMEQ